MTPGSHTALETSPSTGTPAGKPRVGRRLFITWYPYCRRSDAIAEQIGARSHLIHYLRFKVPSLAPLKYPLQGLRTASILLRERPTVVLVAAPPVVAPLVIWLGSLLLRYRFVIDAHSGVFQHARWIWALPVQRFLARRALATIVTNERMADIVRSWGGRAVLVQDLALKLNPEGEALRLPGFHVVFICTYSVDEPVEAVLEAARALPDVTFSLTGDPAYAPKGLRESLPPNVRMTGFIPDSEYLALLRGADVILVLTSDDDTMQRGAYEAVSLEKPLITSDWPLLRSVFARGTLHVDNTPEAIAGAVRKARARWPALRVEMSAWRMERERASALQLATLRRLCEAGEGAR